MDLLTYLKNKDMTFTDFAGRIDVSPQAVHRYARRERIPTPPIMRRIVEQTDGAVRADDFFECVVAAE